jgi:hypothetical protein
MAVTFQTITSGFGTTASGPQIVSNAVFTTMTAIINVLIAAQPNVVTIKSMFAQLDGQVLLLGPTISLQSILTLLVNAGIIEFCALTNTYYLSLRGAPPLTTAFTNSGM